MRRPRFGQHRTPAGISSDIPTDQNGIAVTYRSKVSYAWWKAKLRGTAETPPPDVIYLNSLFSVPFALQPLRAAKSLGIRVVLAPRGMLGAGALGHQARKEEAFSDPRAPFRPVSWRPMACQHFGRGQ